MTNAQVFTQLQLVRLRKSMKIATSTIFRKPVAKNRKSNVFSCYLRFSQFFVSKFFKNRENSRFSLGPQFFQFQQILQLRANLDIRNSAKYSSTKTSHTHREPFFLYLQFNKTLFSPMDCRNRMARWLVDCPSPSFTQRQLSN